MRRYKIRVCRGPECGDKHNSRELYDELAKQVTARDLSDRVDLGWQSCFGRCRLGRNCLVREILPDEPPSRFLFAAPPPSRRRRATALYNELTTADAALILDEHVLGGHVVRRLIHRPKTSDTERNE